MSGCLSPIALAIMVTRPPIRIGPWVACVIRSMLAIINVTALTGRACEAHYIMKSSSLDTEVMFSSFPNRV